MTATGVGRPRLSTRRRPGATAREEILDAAAELFTTRGFTGTSTRMIADAVGIRQASMYHHFATKDDILATLLLGTVAGPVERAEQIRINCEDPMVRMYALALFDASQLAASRWNLGALYLLPEVSTDRFADFRRLRNELMVRYSSFAVDALRANGGSDCGPGTPELPFRLVEAMIGARSDAISPRAFALTPHTIAAAALRTLGWSGPTEPIAHSAVVLLDQLAESCPQPGP
ncbi:TetR/AcrR family transcriptional regulator [Rhodococcus spongiicola]|uniref:TetR/AcrR family transcriptional regulator n=1 Tax=Rhodococcus spongiicola TaxID=2487352 RepID=A0A438AXK5_9NOCA|nr:TetR/AcrR family transcriptional regulator [Rhodococcus spongiicola]RVW03447.1 TetR/AcrR family transcriptional regulator [Rhodococcus spongiicola]